MTATPISLNLKKESIEKMAYISLFNQQIYRKIIQIYLSSFIIGVLLISTLLYKYYDVFHASVPGKIYYFSIILVMFVTLYTTIKNLKKLYTQMLDDRSSMIKDSMTNIILDHNEIRIQSLSKDDTYTTSYKYSDLLNVTWKRKYVIFYLPITEPTRLPVVIIYNDLNTEDLSYLKRKIREK